MIVTEANRVACRAPGLLAFAEAVCACPSSRARVLNLGALNCGACLGRSETFLVEAAGEGAAFDMVVIELLLLPRCALLLPLLPVAARTRLLSD